MDVINMLQVAAFSILLGYVLATLPNTSGISVRRAHGRSADWRGAEADRNPGILLMVLVVIVSLVFVRDVIVGSTPFGSTTIGGVMEKRDYVEEYYVFAFPDSSGAMSYKVKAEIHSYRKYDGLDLNRVYEINRIFLPDGRAVTFNGTVRSGYSLDPGRMVPVKDDAGRVWRIQLTEEKVENK